MRRLLLKDKLQTILNFQSVFSILCKLTPHLSTISFAPQVYLLDSQDLQLFNNFAVFGCTFTLPKSTKHKRIFILKLGKQNTIIFVIDKIN